MNPCKNCDLGLKRKDCSDFEFEECNRLSIINIGDKVRNIRDGRLGIVIRVFESGSIAVLENVAPTVINTHNSSKTLEMVEKHSVDIFDETKI